MSDNNKTFSPLEAQKEMTEFYEKTITKLDGKQALELWDCLLWKMINQNKVERSEAYNCSKYISGSVLIL